MLIVSIIVVVLLAAFALMPVKKPEQSIGPVSDGERVVYRDAPVQYQPVSIRQQMINEEAKEVESFFIDRAHDAWRKEVAAKAVTLIGGTTADA